MNNVAAQIDPELHSIRDAVETLQNGPMKVFVADYQPDVVLIISTKDDLNSHLRELVQPILVNAQRDGLLSTHREQKKENQN